MYRWGGDFDGYYVGICDCAFVLEPGCVDRGMKFIYTIIRLY